MRIPALIVCLVLCSGTCSGRWSLLNRPVSTPLRAVCALPDGLAWFAGNGGVVYSTTDFGATWYPQTIRFQSAMLSVDFTSSGFGCVTGENGDAAVSVNGGAYWTHTVIAKDDLGIGLPDRISPVICPNDSTAWALAHWWDTTFLYRSLDAGTTWDPVKYTSYAYNAPNTIYHMAFTSAQAGWLACGRFDGAKFLPVLLRTTDAGATWQAFDAPASAVDSAPDPDWQASVCAVSPDRVIVHYRDVTRSVGTLFELKRTTPATGWTWSARPWNESVSTITARGTDNVVLVGDFTWETRNGFATVHKTNNPGGTALTADFIPNGTGYGVSADGNVYFWTPEIAGDWDGDRMVTLADACGIAAAVLNETVIGPDMVWAADLTGDNEVSLADAAEALKLAGGLAK